MFGTLAVLMVPWMNEYLQTVQNVYIKCVHFLVYKSYLNDTNKNKVPMNVYIQNKK